MTIRQAIAISDYMAAILPHRAGQEGRVHSAHARLVNVAFPGDHLLTIQAPDVVRTPLSLVAPWPETDGPELSPGQKAFMDGRTGLFHCGDWEISLSGAAVFATRVRIQPKLECCEAWRILEQHFAVALERGSIHDFIQSGVLKELEVNSSSRQYGEMLRRRIDALTTAVRVCNADAAARAACGLIGLGPGLTPAGDDFLQGFFLFAQAFSRIGTVSDECCGLLQMQERLDTTEISRALWRSFLSGHAAEPVKNLAEAFNSDDWKIFSRQVELISLIGHSSGDDFLTGAWWALRQLAGENISVVRPMPA